MSDNVSIAVIIVIAIIFLILFVLRRQDVSKISVTAGGVTSNVETRESGAVTLKGVKQSGDNHQLNVSRGSTHIEDFEQNGSGNITHIRSEKDNI